MDFKDFALKNDTYLYFWIVYFKPILNYNNTYEDFIRVNEKWADFSEYRNTIKKNKSSITYEKNTSFTGFKLFSYLDSIFKKIFLKKTMRRYEKLGKPFGVIISNDLLKFHDKDIRKKVSERI